MTISKGSALTITTGVGTGNIAAFSSSQAGTVYTLTTLRGFLLDISGTTVTKAGGEAVLHTAPTGPFQRSIVRRVSSTNLRAVTLDSTPQIDVIPITKTATQLVGGTPYTMSWPAAIDNIGLALEMCADNWDSDTLVMILRQNTTPITWYLSLTNDTTQGNVVQFSPATAPAVDGPAFAFFSSTSGIMVYQESSTLDFMGVPLSKSGLTLSAGSEFQIDSVDPESLTQGALAASRVSSSRIFTPYIDDFNDRRVRTIDSPTTVNSATTDAASDVVAWAERFHANSVVLFSDDQAGTSFWTEFTVAGNGSLTKTNTLSESGQSQSHARAFMDNLDTSHIISAFGDAGTLKAIVLTTDVSPPGISTSQFTAAPMTPKPCDIDADGTNIYIGALSSNSTPILIQFATALNANGLVVFNPGSGDNIGVECSRGDGDEVTVAGQFDGTNVVERSEDAGSTFSVIDDTTIGGVASFIVGPDSDNRIMVFDEDNFDILETIDEGTTWVSNNASVSQVLRVLARLGIDVNQLIAGTSSADSAQVLHSPNAGAELEDIELDAFGLPNVDVNGILIN